MGPGLHQGGSLPTIAETPPGVCRGWSPGTDEADHRERHPDTTKGRNMKATTTNPTPCPNEVRWFLKGLTYGPAGRAIDVRSDGSESRPSITVEPRWRRRADHYGDDGGWDSRAWSEEYERPIVKIVQSQLDREFGEGTTDVMITCAGYVSVDIYQGGS